MSNLFKKVHPAERDWLKCKDRAKKIVLKHEYVLLRKHFGKEVQRCKRLHWYKTQNELLADVNCSNQEKFWKNIGKVGIVSDRNKGIHMQVVLDNGDVSNDL